VRGDYWSVNYRAAPTGHRLDAQYEDLTAYTFLTSGAFGVGGAYTDGAFFVSVNHVSATSDSQSLSIGHSFTVTPELVLAPTLTATRSTEDGPSMAGSASLTASLSADAVVGALRLQTPIPFDDGWRVSAALASRTHIPIGYRADVSVTTQTVAGNLTVT